MLPKTTNKTLTTAYTEYSHTFQRNVKKFVIQCRTAADIRIAFEDGVTAPTAPTGPYITVKSGTKYESPEFVNHRDVTVFLVGASNGLIVEISEWY